MAETEKSTFEKVLSQQDASDLLGIHLVTLLRWHVRGASRIGVSGARWFSERKQNCRPKLLR